LILQSLKQVSGRLVERTGMPDVAGMMIVADQSRQAGPITLAFSKVAATVS
jgi:hypothetical protein